MASVTTGSSAPSSTKPASVEDPPRSRSTNRSTSSTRQMPDAEDDLGRERVVVDRAARRSRSAASNDDEHDRYFPNTPSELVTAGSMILNSSCG